MGAVVRRGVQQDQGGDGHFRYQELVNTFIANEDQNFSLFNYASQQNNEIETREQLHHCEENKSFSASLGTMPTNISSYSTSCAEAADDRNVGGRYESKFQDGLKTVNSLKVGIHHCFQSECSASNMADMLLTRW